MQTAFTVVPFRMDEKISQISGVGKFSSAGIILEYEGKIFGIIKHGVKESRIALDEILDVTFRKGTFKRGAKIEIRLKNFAKLNETPNRDGKIILKIDRADFERAADAVGKLQKDLTAHQENLPPTRTPVSELFTEEKSADEN